MPIRLFSIFLKGHNSTMGDNSEKKNTSQLFSYEESIYEIPDSSFNGSKVTVHIKNSDGRMHGWTSKKQYAPPTVFKVVA